MIFSGKEMDSPAIAVFYPPLTNVTSLQFVDVDTTLRSTLGRWLKKRIFFHKRRTGPDPREYGNVVRMWDRGSQQVLRDLD